MWRLLIMWSALAGAAIGAGMNMAGSAMNSYAQYGTSKALAKYNYELGQRSIEASPGNYKRGLEKAGINPILASNSPIGSTSGSSGVNPGMDLASAATKGSSAVQYKKATDSQIRLNDANGKANLIQAEAALKNAETNEKGLALGYTNTVVNGLNNAAGGSVVPLINSKRQADAIIATKGVSTNSAKGMNGTVGVVPTPTSSKSVVDTIKSVGSKVGKAALSFGSKAGKAALGTAIVGGIPAVAGLGLTGAAYGVGKAMEHRGLDKYMNQGPTKNDLRHRTAGLGSSLNNKSKSHKRRHN